MKKAVIGCMVAILTMLHRGTTNLPLELHILHRELFFLPILLAAFTFGLKGGLVVSGVENRRIHDVEVSREIGPGADRAGA